MVVEIPTPEERAFVQEHLQDDVSALALQLRKYPDLDARIVLRQVAGFQAMRRKVPSWAGCGELLFPENLPLEQCSSEPTARYKVSVIPSQVRRIADLTGGLGVDFAFMAQDKDKAVYLERNEDLCQKAGRNFKALGLEHAEVLHGDGPSRLDGQFDLLFLDPARRDAKGGKVVALSDCEPDIAAIKHQLFEHAPLILVKLSPMLDLTLALQQLPETTQIHVVSVDNECKELLFLLSAEPVTQEPRILCVNLRGNGQDQRFEFSRNEEQKASCRFAEKPGKYLYEPNASLLKAGAFSILTQSFDLSKLHPNSHLYTSEQLVEQFPGRIFSVEAYFPLHPKELKTHLAGITKANISVRNYPDSVAELRKKTKLKDGGDTYLFATTLQKEQKVLVKCRKFFLE